MTSNWRRSFGNLRSFIGNSTGGLRGGSNIASWLVAGTVAYYLWVKPSQDLRREQQERALAAVAADRLRYIEKRKPKEPKVEVVVDAAGSKPDMKRRMADAQPAAPVVIDEEEEQPAPALPPLPPHYCYACEKKFTKNGLADHYNDNLKHVKDKHECDRCHNFFETEARVNDHQRDECRH
ncbi:hypothetical protein ACFE04_015509 [Oxalis oulophora]